MKIINQIFIIVFIAASLLLAKDDVVDIYHHSIEYFGDKISTILNKEEGQSFVAGSDNQDNGIKEVVKLNKVIETPGALKVTDNLFTFNNVNPKLSSKNIIEITNKYRIENGNLKLLNENQKLNFSAEKKLQDMFLNQYFEHLSPEGIGVSDLVEQVSYEYITVGENLAMGNFKNDQALVGAWMASPGHRDNILNEHYTEIGVAVGEGLFEGKKVWIAVQHLGLPRSVCPVIDEVLHGIITVNEKQIKTMENDLNIRRENIDSRAVHEDLTTNEQINEYNSLILIYNQLISELKGQINNYNKQVQAFNSCLAENTASIEQ
jgi:uncharacterized protein YkwD